MQEFPVEIRRYLALLLPPASFFALRSVNVAFRAALSDSDYYFRPLLEGISTFKPIPSTVYFSSYEKIFIAIQYFSAYSDDFFLVIRRSEFPVRLILQTPLLLEKLLQVNNSLECIIVLLHDFPNVSDLLFKNSALTSLYINTRESWVQTFMYTIDKNTDVYNGFISCEAMIRAFANSYNKWNYNHETLCRYLQKKYHPEQRYIDAVYATYGEDREAVYNLLKSLKPYNEEELSEQTTVVLDNNVTSARRNPKPVSTCVQTSRRQAHPPSTKDKRPLPPPPPQSSSPQMKKPSVKRPLPPSPLRTVDVNIPAPQKLASSLRFVSTVSNNPLHLAVLNAEIELVKHFMKNKKLNCANKNGDYPIHIAVKAGNEELVRLLASDAEMLKPLNKEGLTAYQLAKKIKYPHIISALVEVQQHQRVGSGKQVCN